MSPEGAMSERTRTDNLAADQARHPKISGRVLFPDIILEHSDQYLVGEVVDLLTGADQVDVYVLPPCFRHLGDTIQQEVLEIEKCTGSFGDGQPVYQGVFAESAAEGAGLIQDGGAIRWLRQVLHNQWKQLTPQLSMLSFGWLVQALVPFLVAELAPAHFQTCLLYTSPSPRDRS